MSDIAKLQRIMNKLTIKQRALGKLRDQLRGMESEIGSLADDAEEAEEELRMALGHLESATDTLSKTI